MPIGDRHCCNVDVRARLEQLVLFVIIDCSLEID
jgi:hypothetical protein